MMKRTFPKLRFCIAILLLLGCPLTQARHIIGGDISYECLGEGHYRFTMKIYRDCSNPFGDDFDYNAPMAVFRGNQSFTMVQNFYAPIQLPITMIPPDVSNPCLILPPNICVQQGIYVFDLELPVIDESYHIVYQRCCRNNSISNIISPEESGATYSIELTPFAQATCNNSPVFNAFPPVVICNAQPLEFDHSATDEEGDQLVYELCSPLLGAGVVGFLLPGDPTSCDGYRPDPPCAPPYDPVHFVAPTYGALNPMGGNPAVGIHPGTGLISGTPFIQGQFVVGICVSEYRNGELLSVTRRDFQFNVANCEPTVVARIQADEVIDNEEFIIKACHNPVTLFNESFQEAYIDDYYWELDLAGTDTVVQAWNAQVEFPGPGQYEGKLILNPGSECGDTAAVQVHVFPGVEAAFAFAYDTCVAGPVQFTDHSVAHGAPVEEWTWDFSDGHSMDEQHPKHLYTTPGEFPVSLKVIDGDGCEDQIDHALDYRPVPDLILIAPSNFIGCTPADIFFNNLSTPIDETYQIDWDFGDGGFSQDISPSHIFELPGIYDIAVHITSPIGCETDTVFEKLITIQPSPLAGFTYTPDDPTNVYPDVEFFDQSQDAVRWFWDFGTGRTSILQDPVYEFPDTGQYLVTQIVTHPLGCQDSISQLIDVRPEIRFFLPNAFTPNSDSVNDTYQGVGLLTGISNFRLAIWNRWGELIFETRDPDEGWNGRYHNQGKDLPDGRLSGTGLFYRAKGRTI